MIHINIIKTLIFSLLFLVLSVSRTSAHVTVKPAEVGLGSWSVFTVAVPVEKEIPTTEVKLEIPKGLKHVTPNVKPGWKITVNKQGSGEESVVTEIIWTGGSIPVGQRDEFVFSAQVPSTTQDLNWKAYQTYADKSVVSWNEDPKSHNDEHGFEKSGPYSITKVVNDLSDAPSNMAMTEAKSTQSNLLVIASLAMSGVALFLSLSKLKK